MSRRIIAAFPRAAVSPGGGEGRAVAGKAGGHAAAGGGRPGRVHVRHHTFRAVLLRPRVDTQPGCSARAPASTQCSVPARTSAS